MKQTGLFILAFFYTFLGVASSQLTNLPTVYIRTNNNAPINSKETYVKGTLTIVSDTSLAGLYIDSTEIRGRGNSSWNLQKKPYRLKLYEKCNLLGMPAVDDIWVLLANHADKTLMRNALAFEISELCGLYFTPAYRFVDVVLNDTYIGNYMLTDQVKHNKKRVNVEKLTDTDTVMPDLTGGFLLEVDGFGITTTAVGDKFPEAFTSQLGNKVTIKYPDENDILSEQRSYLIHHYNLFEQSVMNYVVGMSDTSTLSKYLDLDAFVNWYIATEMTANPDCVWSIYIKKHRNDDRFYFGPLWDNDISFANCNRKFSVLDDGRNESIMVRCFDGLKAKTLVKKILTVPEIQTLIAKRWHAIKAGFKDSLLHHIDSTNVLLNASQALNYQKWPVLNSIVYNELTTRGSYTAEVDFLRSYMSDRVDYLDGYFTAMDTTIEEPDTTELPEDPDMLFTPEPNRLYYLQCQNDKYLYSEAFENGYRLAASTTLPEDKSLAQFEITWSKEISESAEYYLRNRACNRYVYINDTAGSVPLDSINKTPFQLYESPNEANHFGLMALSENPGINNKGIDCNSTSVVIWRTTNKKGQREYQFIEANDTIVGLGKTWQNAGYNHMVLGGSGVITLRNFPVNQLVSIYGIDGRLITTVISSGSDQFIPVNKGVYIVRVANRIVKVMVK